jgi:hypothetical protein
VLGESLAVGERYLPFENEAEAADTSAFEVAMEDLLLY